MAKKTLKTLTHTYDRLSNLLGTVASCPGWNDTTRAHTLTQVGTVAKELANLLDAGVRKSSGRDGMVELSERLCDQAAAVAERWTATTDHNGWYTV